MCEKKVYGYAYQFYQNCKLNSIKMSKKQQKSQFLKYGQNQILQISCSRWK